MAGKSNIEAKVLKVVDKWDSGSGEIQIRVVQWIIDGQVKSTNLEKRDFYEKDGETRMGKAKGFNIADMRTIFNKWKEIKPLMQGEEANDNPGE